MTLLLKNRVNCFTAGCSKCEKAVLIKKNIFKQGIYKCPKLLKKHKEIDAYKCKEFRCSKCNEGNILCRDCKKGE